MAKGAYVRKHGAPLALHYKLKGYTAQKIPVRSIAHARVILADRVGPNAEFDKAPELRKGSVHYHTL